MAKIFKISSIGYPKCYNHPKCLKEPTNMYKSSKICQMYNKSKMSDMTKTHPKCFICWFRFSVRYLFTFFFRLLLDCVIRTSCFCQCDIVSVWHVVWCDIDIIVRAVEATGCNIGEFVSIEYFAYCEHFVFVGSILCLCDIDSSVRAVEVIGHNISEYFDYCEHCVFWWHIVFVWHC